MRLARLAVLATFVFSLAAPIGGRAQPAARVAHIGIIYEVLPVAAGVKQPTVRAFRAALREAGYQEGRRIRFEDRSAEGQLDRVPDIVAELVRLGVDVIVTTTNPVALRVKEATVTVPIVMGMSSMPVEVGLVQSLSRPGGNITGLTVDAGPESEAKRLELLREVAPTITRVAYIGRKKDWDAPIGQEAQRTAQRLGLTLVLADYAPAATPAEYAAAFRVVLRVPRAEAVFPAAAGPNFTYRRILASFTAKNRLPAVHLSRESAAEGGLMSYGPSHTDLFRRAATYVDKILKGAKPADLPVEPPTKFELVINRASRES